tara:strand:- start:86 stop:1045 length:960 start_codon:yes stop_codon:yes gene_type:complete
MATTALVTGVLTTTAATVFNGGFAANDGSTISTADNTDTLTLISTDADANVAPNLVLYRNSDTPADNDQLGKIKFTGVNDNNEDIVYTEFVNQIRDASDGTEDGRFAINVMTAGTGIARLDMLPAETVFNESGHNISFRVESDSGTNMFFVDGGNNRVYINDNTGPDLFYIKGNATSTAMGIRIGTNGYNAIEFDNATGSLVGRITTSAASTAYVTSSDYRLKENVDYTWDATTRLKQLKPARFNWITDDTNTLIDGFLAHEVSGVVPEAVIGEKDAVHPDGHHEAGEMDPQGIDHSKLVPLLVKTIQELESRITALEP